MLRNRPFGLNMTQAGVKTKNAFSGIFVPGAPKEIRTLVLALKGLRPGPLDDGGIKAEILP